MRRVPDNPHLSGDFVGGDTQVRIVQDNQDVSLFERNLGESAPRIRLTDIGGPDDPMATNVVNLDALIPRENFDLDAEHVPLNRETTISISAIRDPNFFGGFRKPDFQRETNHWSPNKIADLVGAFLNADLIPAIILWQSGPFIFVIDGAHRLSALYAWIIDDYGDRSTSQKYFGHIPDEQMRIAEKTRKTVEDSVGTFDSYIAAQSKPLEDLTPIMKARLAKVRVHSFTAQWVLSNDPAVAQDSFFKINQAATPLDPVEARILQARHSANSLAARAIAHGGGGHRYWKNFQPNVREQIGARGRSLYNQLYRPPMDEGYIKTMDVPIAGRGYSTLPFVFDLVNLANDQKITDSTAKRPIKESLVIDEDGTKTVSFLNSVSGLLGRISGHGSQSLGLHPLAYFYSRTGTFQPVAFFAMAKLLEKLDNSQRLIEFTKIRASFEEYLTTQRDGMSIIIHRLGSGSRSLAWMQSYFERILAGLWEGKTIEQIKAGFADERDWAFITQPPGPSAHESSKTGGRFNRNTKSAAVIAGIYNVRRCALCGGFVHRNSQQVDHAQDKQADGSGEFHNAQVTHPYCNSIKEHLR
jgi:hypothetical protein